MTDEDKLAEEWLDERYLKDMGVRKPCKEAYRAGFKDGYSKCNARLVKAKKIIKEMLSILPKENIEGVYEITEEAEQFLRESE